MLNSSFLNDKKKFPKTCTFGPRSHSKYDVILPNWSVFSA
ncbi:hypothetical protein KSF78_0005672 [Schistosoma japonicum]|nr:hypothetical protein KSF78_0005672 [Schistosoma japonicum]